MASSLLDDPLPPFAGLAEHLIALRRAQRMSQRDLAAAAAVPPLPFSWLRNGASGLRVRHDFPPLLLMIRGVVSPGPEASTDR